MGKLQEMLALSNEAALRAARLQEEKRDMANFAKLQSQELAHMRIERNRAARHARCATMRTK